MILQSLFLCSDCVGMSSFVKRPLRGGLGVDETGDFAAD